MNCKSVKNIQLKKFFLALFMKKISVVILTIFLSFISVFSQTQKEFVGALLVPKNQIITYKLSFDINEENIIEGLSTTDFMGGDKTVSKIIGKLTSDSVLSFHEISNLSTISSSNNASFCYVYVDGIKLKNISGTVLIQGAFIGKYPNGNKCAEGKINLVSTNMLSELKTMIDTSHTKKDSVSTKKITSFLDEAIAPIEKMKTLHDNEELVIEWANGPIVFDIWDGFLEDKDVISIYQEDQLIEANYTIKNIKKTFTLPFVSDSSLIKIVAINEGGTISNTVNYNFKNDQVETNFISSLKKGESVFIRIVKK